MVKGYLQRLVALAGLVLLFGSACARPDEGREYILDCVTLPIGSEIIGSDDSLTSYQVGYVFSGSQRPVESTAVWFNHRHGWKKVSSHIRARMKLAGMVDHTSSVRDAGPAGPGAAGTAMATSVEIFSSADDRYVASLYNNAEIREAQPGFLPPRLAGSDYLLVVIDYGETGKGD